VSLPELQDKLASLLLPSNKLRSVALNNNMSPSVYAHGNENDEVDDKKGVGKATGRDHDNNNNDDHNADDDAGIDGGDGNDKDDMVPP
jgi:hypothetical protein